MTYAHLLKKIQMYVAQIILVQNQLLEVAGNLEFLF